MDGSKYGKYIIRGVAGKESIPGVMPAAFGEPGDWAGMKHRMKWDYVSKPVELEEAHSHDFEEFLCFMGSNPNDKEDFGAEVEVSMGTEGEKHVFNTPTVILVPSGMAHSPINFRKVDKPVIFCSIYMAQEYVKKPV